MVVEKKVKESMLEETINIVLFTELLIGSNNIGQKFYFFLRLAIEDVIVVFAVTPTYGRTHWERDLSNFMLNMVDWMDIVPPFYSKDGKSERRLRSDASIRFPVNPFFSFQRICMDPG